MDAIGAEEKVLEQLGKGFPGYLEDVRAAIRQPSVSRTGEGIDAMVTWLISYLGTLGVEAHRAPGVRFPIIEGTLSSQGAVKTLLLYELYDVQPADETGWISPPFEAAVHPVRGGGNKIVGRGAFNSKGPLVGFLTVLRAFHDAGIALPLNVRFLIEGEEEIGSPSLESYVRRHLDQLRKCHAAFIPYMATNRHGRIQIRLGFKGLALLEFTVEGGPWGGPAEHDLHAMHAAWVGSPAWELLNALTCLQAEDGRLKVDGLDSFVTGPSEEDRELLRKLGGSFDADPWRAELGIRRFKYEGDPARLLTHLMFDPTLNLLSLRIGENKIEEEPSTVLSRRAVAHADLRLVPDMEVDRTMDYLRAHLDRRGFEHVAVKVKSAYPWSKTSAREPVVQSLVAACRKHGGEVELFPLHAGAAPLYLFSKVLGIPFAFGGLGHGGLSHVANEYLSVEGLQLFQRSMVSFLFDFARGGCEA
jgi:acetylornithine deacetylase/succinyl-diaminopimelate desuccinylase-like protein